MSGPQSHHHAPIGHEPQADVARAAPPAPRLFRYRAAQFDHPMVLIAEHNGWVWLDRGGEPVTARATWVVEISQTPENTDA